MTQATVTFNKTKYENAILYFTKHCNNKFLGQTKLNKLMYYLDFISYRDRGQSVTADNYVHKEYGPVPEKIDELLVSLTQEGKLAVTYEYIRDDVYRSVFAKVTEPDMSVFDPYEQKLLENICTEFISWSTDKIVSQTHLESPWFYSKPYELVDYDYAADIDFFQNGTSAAMGGK